MAGEVHDIKIKRLREDPLSGTVIEVDGHELPELHRVVFDHEAGSLALVTGEMYVWGGLEFECPAHLELSVVVPEGCELEEIQSAGGRIYRCRESASGRRDGKCR